MKQSKLGKYEVLDRLGRGGMAEVYRGYHASLDRYVAIKILHSFLSDNPEFKTRFELEAQNIAKLRHPHIVQVYDFEHDEEWGSYYMVMELIDGPTLRDRLYSISPERATPLPLSEAIRISREAAQALSYAHKRGMIHRDVKPANLMLDAKDNNRIVLTDFGIAKLMSTAQLTVSGGLIGTPAYMAPEQGMGESGDERSDLYSLGIILYQMLTGELPYDADTPVVLLLSHMHDPIPSARSVIPHLPPAVDKVLYKLMAKQPTERYQTAQELIDDLEILEKRPAQLDPATIVLPKAMSLSTDTGQIAQPAIPARQPRRGLWLAAFIAGLTILLGGGYFVGAGVGVFPPPMELVAWMSEPTETPTPTDAPTDTPSPTETPQPTDTAIPSPSSPTASRTQTRTPTLTRTSTLTATPTATATSTSPSTATNSSANAPTPNQTATVAAERTATVAACRFDYAIIEHVPGDGVNGPFFRVNEPYRREITFLNAGSCAWEPNTSLTWLEGESFAAGPRIFIRQTVEPGAEITVVFEGRLPRQGSVEPISGLWELRTPGQVPIGQPFTISVRVFDPGS